MFITKQAARSKASQATRLIIPIASALACLWLLTNSVRIPSLTELTNLIGQITWANWLGAGLATLVSFWALGRYDGVAHRHLNTGLDCTRARLAGMLSIAFSQTVGFGVITGSFARWRLLPGLSPMRAAQLTALTGLTFMAALACVVGFALLLARPFPFSMLIGAGLLLACAAGVVATFFWPTFSVGKHKVRWPSITAMLALGGWTLLDVTAAGTALWLVMPPESGITLWALLPAYFIALGLAIVSSSPGGAGPLELALVSLLATTDAASVIAGLVAFRVVYYAVPAVAAGIVLLWPSLLGPRTHRFEKLALVGSRKDSAHTIAFSRPRSETAIIRQNGGHVHSFGFNQLALLETPQTTVAFFDPINGHAPETFEPLRDYANGRNTSACFYKCTPRVALAARRSGWRLLRIAQEAVLNPMTFTEAGSDKRQLRRKLRNAEKSGIVVRDAADALPMSQLARVDRDWHDNHGNAHGTTMGRFEPNYLKGQQVLVAWQEGIIIGFVSFHVSDQEWCLDLIRMGPDAPDGTGHAMIRTAIASAAEENITRLSLAAVPDHRYADRVERGLRRFKACFAPYWQPLYMAAPTWGAMAICLAEMIRLVHRPSPIQPAQAWAPSDLRTESTSGWDDVAHNKDEEKEFVFARRA